MDVSHFFRFVRCTCSLLTLCHHNQFVYDDDDDDDDDDMMMMMMTNCRDGLLSFEEITQFSVNHIEFG